MHASLPMYDWPEVWAENDALWSKMRDALRAQGIEAPDALDRSTGYTQSWTHADLVLGQACGLPYIRELSTKVALIGALDLGLKGCAPGQYNSHIVVHQKSGLTPGDLAGRPYAFNSACSQSGLNALNTAGLAAGRGTETGSHRASMQMVACGDADFAAIDAHTWTLAERFEPATQSLRILSHTSPTPGPVYIAAKGVDVAAYRKALSPFLVLTEAADYAGLL